MYAYFKGKIATVSPEGIILENHGIGYHIKTTEETRNRLLSMGGEVKVHTYTYVKEDAFQLYGFLSEEELELFKKMITVSGIGPKGAMAILSVLPVDTLLFAIISGDSKAISKAPGIGAKTAQRLILDLKDKVSAEDILPAGETQEMPVHTDSLARKEAVEALVALGYSQSEAARAVNEIKDGDLNAEAYLKQSLKYLF